MKEVLLKQMLKAHLMENNCIGVYFQFDSNGNVVVRNHIIPPDLEIQRLQNKINSLLNDTVRHGAL